MWTGEGRKMRDEVSVGETGVAYAEAREDYFMTP